MTGFHQMAGMAMRAHEWAGTAAGFQLKLWRQATELAVQAPFHQLRVAQSLMAAQQRLLQGGPAAAPQEEMTDPAPTDAGRAAETSVEPVDQPKVETAKAAEVKRAPRKIAPSKTATNKTATTKTATGTSATSKSATSKSTTAKPARRKVPTRPTSSKPAIAAAEQAPAVTPKDAAKPAASTPPSGKSEPAAKAPVTDPRASATTSEAKATGPATFPPSRRTGGSSEGGESAAAAKRPRQPAKPPQMPQSTGRTTGSGKSDDKGDSGK